MTLPNDPAILLSFVNTKLRDEYSDLNDLCSGLCVPKEKIENSLSKIGYVYNKENNRFM